MDRWDLALGDDVPKFMEKSVRRAHRVVMVCTEQYVRKADDGEGGAGYEAMVVTGELVADLGTRKFIPIMRQTTDTPILPACVSTRLYVDFSNPENFASKFEELARDVQNAPKIEKPPLGLNPYTIKSASLATEAESRKPYERSPLETYSVALSLANSGDFAKWRALIHTLKGDAATSLLSWKVTHQSQCPEVAKELVSYFLPGIASYNNLFAGAFGAFDSSDERFHNQLSLIDWIRRPNGWERSGPTIWVQLPELVLFTYQAILGALAMSRNRPQLVYSLLVTQLSNSNTARDVRPLYKHSTLTGWPESLGGNCSLGWKFLQVASGDWEWLWHVFGSREDLEAAIIAYYAFMSTVDFISASKVAHADGSRLRDLESPIFLSTGNPELNLQAQRLYFAHASFLNTLFEDNGLKSEELLSLWEDWTKRCEDWVRAVYRGGHGRWSDLEIPQKTLASSIRQGSTKRIVE